MSQVIDPSRIEALVREAVRAALPSQSASPSDPPGWVDGKPNLRVSISARPTCIYPTKMSKRYSAKAPL